MSPAGLFCTNLKKAVDNSPFSWYNNTRRQGRHASYGGLAQLGARLVSKHTPSQMVLRQSIPNKKLHPRGSLLGFYGGLAQLGERLHGMQEVTGSIPVFSTKKALYFV